MIRAAQWPYLSSIHRNFGADRDYRVATCRAGAACRQSANELRRLILIGRFRERPNDLHRRRPDSFRTIVWAPPPPPHQAQRHPIWPAHCRDPSGPPEPKTRKAVCRIFNSQRPSQAQQRQCSATFRPTRSMLHAFHDRRCTAHRPCS